MSNIFGEHNSGMKLIIVDKNVVFALLVHYEDMWDIPHQVCTYVCTLFWLLMKFYSQGVDILQLLNFQVLF